MSAEDWDIGGRRQERRGAAVRGLERGLMTRPSWDEYFLAIAHTIATRASCDRKKVGCVIVDPDHRIVATGFNGSAAGMPHCDDVGHEFKEIDGRESCVRTLHSESNAIDYVGGRAKGCTLYCTAIPCYSCAKRIVNVGIERVIYGEYYQSQNTDLVVEYFKEAGVWLQQEGNDASDVS